MSKNILNPDEKPIKEKSPDDLLATVLTEPPPRYSRQAQGQMELFADEQLSTGKLLEKNLITDSNEPILYYQHPNGEIWVGDSLRWLQGLASETVDMVLADPPYNINKAEWDTFESQQAYVNWSLKWVEEAARVLKPTGTLYICGFSEILADIKLPALRFFEGCRWLVWHYKNKANLHSDWGRSHELDFGHFPKSIFCQITAATYSTNKKITTAYRPVLCRPGWFLVLYLTIMTKWPKSR